MLAPCPLNVFRYPSLSDPCPFETAVSYPCWALAAAQLVNETHATLPNQIPNGNLLWLLQ